MLSPRVGQTTVRLIRACAGVRWRRRNRFWLGLTFVVMLVASAGAAIAWWDDSGLSGDRRLLNSSIRTIPAGHIKFLAASPQPAFFDISAVSVTTVPAASFESVPVAPDSIVSAFGSNLAT